MIDHFAKDAKAQASFFTVTRRHWQVPHQNVQEPGLITKSSNISAQNESKAAQIFAEAISAVPGLFQNSPSVAAM